MWHKAIWKGHPMRLELTRVGLLVELANHYTTCVVGHECFFKCWATECNLSLHVITSVFQSAVIYIYIYIYIYTYIYIYIYTYFKLHDLAAHKYLEYRRDLVKRQITLCSSAFKKHSCPITQLFSPKNKSYITFVIDPSLMMAQSRTESTRDTYNYREYMNQFPPNTIKVIREFERIQKKICRHKISIMFNEICIYIYIYIYMKLQSRATIIVLPSRLGL